MIKRILVALDQDADTPVAVDYAFDIAHRNPAEVTGLAVVDTNRIEETSSGGGIGSMHYAEKLREKLTAKTRQRAQELVEQFSHASSEMHIPYHVEIKEGAPSAQIIGELRYHDVLVVGNNPHFFYGHPDQVTTTLANVVQQCVAPVIIVPESYHEIKIAILGYDGSGPSVRAMQRFAQINPFGRDVLIHIVHVCERESEAAGELMTYQASEYLKRHGFETRTSLLKGGSAEENLLGYGTQIKAHLIIAGAHSVSKMRRLAFGSTTQALVENGKFVLFLER